MRLSGSAITANPRSTRRSCQRRRLSCHRRARSPQPNAPRGPRRRRRSRRCPSGCDGRVCERPRRPPRRYWQTPVWTPPAVRSRWRPGCASSAPCASESRLAQRREEKEGGGWVDAGASRGGQECSSERTRSQEIKRQRSPVSRQARRTKPVVAVVIGGGDQPIDAPRGPDLKGKAELRTRRVVQHHRVPQGYLALVHTLPAIAKVDNKERGERGST